MLACIGFRQLACTSLSAIVLVGCTSWRVQNVSPMSFVAETKPGKIRIQREDGSRMVLSRPALVGDSIRGPQGAVAVADVSAIAVRKFDVLKTLGLTLGLGIGVTVVVASAAAEIGKFR